MATRGLLCHYFAMLTILSIFCNTQGDNPSSSLTDLRLEHQNERAVDERIIDELYNRVVEANEEYSQRKANLHEEQDRNSEILIQFAESGKELDEHQTVMKNMNQRLSQLSQAVDKARRRVEEAVNEYDEGIRRANEAEQERAIMREIFGSEEGVEEMEE